MAARKAARIKDYWKSEGYTIETQAIAAEGRHGGVDYQVGTDLVGAVGFLHSFPPKSQSQIA